MNGIKIKDFAKRADAPKPSEKNWNLEKLLATEISLFPTKFKDKDKEAFYLELSTLLSSGLDIKASLELIEEELEKPKHSEIIGKVKAELINGAALWQALQRSGHFTPYEYYSIQIGEETGKLNIVLDQLFQFFSSTLKQRRQFISALSYPIIILITSVGAVGFMLLFMVPMFKDVFKRFGGELPYLTQVIISFSDGIHRYFFIAMLAIGAVVFYFYKNRKTVWFRKGASRAIRRIPVFGKIIYSIQLARFCTSMALLLGSKVPLIRSIGLINQMITFYPIQVTLDSMSKSIMNGRSLHTSMADFNVFSRKMVSMVKVGEEVNKMDVFFEKLANQYKSDVEHQTNLLNTFLEPAMIIFLGIVVGFILLAMYLPMFQLSTTIGG